MNLLAYALSGAAGLIHEVAWSRALGQVVGGSLTAQAAFFTVFLLGLGAGAALAARRAERLRRPLAAYAALEAGIALWGLGSPLLCAAALRLASTLGPHFADGLPLDLARLAVSALVLLPPAILMGATYPVIVQAWPEAARRRGVGLLYGANTLSAAAGALAATFLLLPALGTRRTLAAAAFLNLLAAVLVLFAARRRRGEPAPVPAGPPDTRPNDPPAMAEAADRSRTSWHFVAVAAASGLVGALLQFGWSRAMTLAFGSSVFALGLTLAAVLLGLGLGPIVATALLERRRVAGRNAGPVFGAASAAWMAGTTALLILPLLGGLARPAAMLGLLFQRSPASALALQFALAAGLLVIPAMAQGACLPLLATASGSVAQAARTAGRVYAASTWGSAVGFLLAGFVLIPHLGTRRTLMLASAIAVLLGLLLHRPRGVRFLMAATAPTLLLLLPGWDGDLLSGGGFLNGPLYRTVSGRGPLSETIRRRGEILLQREAGDGLVTVRRSAAGILSLQINGKTEASSGADMATQILAGHLPLLLHPSPRDVLVIGLASGVTLGATALHPVERLRTIEIARGVPEAARLFGAVNGGVLDDPRLDLVLDDARADLSWRDRRYDVIVSQPSNPWVAGVANLFTVEFYRLLRARMLPGGVVCQWVQAYRIEPRDLRGIVGSFLEVFPDATLWEESAGGGDYFLVASQSPMRLDLDRIETESAAVRSDLARAGVTDAADLLARYVTGPTGLREFSRGAARHTDDNLYLEWRAPLALFSDTLRFQAGGLTARREPVAALLDPLQLERRPALTRELRLRLRALDLRRSIATSLQEADLLALREPHLAAGLSLLKLGRYSEAAAALSAAASRNGDSATSHLLLGEAYRGAGLPSAAIVAFEEAVRRDPTLGAAWNALGLCLDSQGRTDSAREAFVQALRVQPGSAPARNNLGALLLRAGDPAGAEAAFRAAIEADPFLAQARVNLGLALRRRGDPAGAEEQYRAALAIDPQSTDALYNLAVVLRAGGRDREAEAKARELLAQDPGDDDARKLLAEIEGR